MGTLRTPDRIIPIEWSLVSCEFGGGIEVRSIALFLPGRNVTIVSVVTRMCIIRDDRPDKSGGKPQWLNVDQGTGSNPFFFFWWNP
jgi:hypothetical protein